MNDAAMRAGAVAVRDGRIVAVGTTAEVMKLRGATTTVTDIPSLQRTLREWVTANKTNVYRHKVIVGFGYDQAQLTAGRC